MAALATERSHRLQTSIEMQEEILGVREPRALLERLLASVLSVTGAERGFVLLIGPDGKLQAEVTAGFASAPLDGRFEGSLGAIERVLATGESVVASNAANDSFLARRPSVLELGIATLACVPLSSEDRRIGLLYVDGRKEGGVFTDLDVEILETLAANVSVVLSSLRIDREIRAMLEGPDGPSADDSAFLAELERRVTDLAQTKPGDVAAGATPSR